MLYHVLLSHMCVKFFFASIMILKIIAFKKSQMLANQNSSVINKVCPPPDECTIIIDKVCSEIYNLIIV